MNGKEKRRCARRSYMIIFSKFTLWELPPLEVVGFNREEYFAGEDVDFHSDL
jgi:hypothetical protein